MSFQRDLKPLTGFIYIWCLLILAVACNPADAAAQGIMDLPDYAAPMEQNEWGAEPVSPATPSTFDSGSTYDDATWSNSFEWTEESYSTAPPPAPEEVPVKGVILLIVAGGAYAVRQLRREEQLEP